MGITGLEEVKWRSMQKQTPLSYQIRLQGHLDVSWSAWFDDLAITHPDEHITVLSGQLQDQAQLHAILIKIRDLNLILVSVNPIQDVHVEEQECPHK